MAKPYEYQYDKGVLPNLGSMVNQVTAPAGLKSWGDLNMFQQAPGPKRPAAAPVAAPVPAVTPLTPVAKPAAPSTYVPGTGLPSAAQVASDKSRALLAQAASDERMGLQAPAAPTTIDVKRQSNGILSFTGSGEGAGVKYSGLPQWTSQRGGAGQGAVGQGFNLGEQNQRMAAALQGIQVMDQQKKADNLIDAMASGAGGPTGVAQNRLAMGALGPLLERQMANESAQGINRTNAETQRRGQDLGLTGDLARVAAAKYGTDVGAQTAAQGFEVEKQKAAAAIKSAQTRASTGKPLSLKDQTALFVFSGKNADGTMRTPAEQAALQMRYAATFGNRDSYMGMLSGEEE